MRDTAVEAYEDVEHGLMTEGNFRNFVFVNPINAKKRNAGNTASGKVRFLSRIANEIVANLTR